MFFFRVTVVLQVAGKFARIHFERFDQFKDRRKARLDVNKAATGRGRDRIVVMCAYEKVAPHVLPRPPL
jgi:hypothetical protein